MPLVIQQAEVPNDWEAPAGENETVLLPGAVQAGASIRLAVELSEFTPEDDFNLLGCRQEIRFLDVVIRHPRRRLQWTIDGLIRRCLLKRNQIDGTKYLCDRGWR